jgi:hypothetical protein
LLALAGPATARDYRAEARAALALSLALQASPVTPKAEPCHCSSECTCGCQAGLPCRCGPPVKGVHNVDTLAPVPYFSRPAYAPAYAPAPFRQSFAPSFRGSAGACRSG